MSSSAANTLLEEMSKNILLSTGYKTTTMKILWILINQQLWRTYILCSDLLATHPIEMHPCTNLQPRENLSPENWILGKAAGRKEILQSTLPWQDQETSIMILPPKKNNSMLIQDLYQNGGKNEDSINSTKMKVFSL